MLLTATGLLPGDASARPGLTVSALKDVNVLPRPGAQVPLAARWRNEDGSFVTLAEALGGRPALLIFADYTCKTLCGPILTFVADALAQSQMASRDYRLLVLGLDPKDGPPEAAAIKRDQVGDGAVASVTAVLTAGEATVRQVANAVGYRFRYDAERDQFAHPAAVLVLTGEGHVSRVLSGLGISAGDLRLALVEAGQGRIGSLRDQVRLFCYGFDPSIGAYTLSIYRSLSIAAALTVLVLAGGIGWMSVRPRRAS